MRRIVMMVLLLATSDLVFSDVIHVPGDHATIQGAINVASKSDEIIVDPGTYYEQIN